MGLEEIDLNHGLAEKHRNNESGEIDTNNHNQKGDRNNV